MLNLLNGYGAAQTFTASDIRPKVLGTLGEQTVIRLAQSLGYLAGKAPMYRGDVYTIAAAGSANERVQHIEVKTARRGKYGTFQFCLKRQIGNRVCTDCHYADVVILLAVRDDFTATMFVIPTAEIGTQKKIEIGDPANPSGKYAKYISGVI